MLLKCICTINEGCIYFIQQSTHTRNTLILSKKGPRLKACPSVLQPLDVRVEFWSIEWTNPFSIQLVWMVHWFRKHRFAITIKNVQLSFARRLVKEQNKETTKISNKSLLDYELYPDNYWLLLSLTVRHTLPARAVQVLHL